MKGKKRYRDKIDTGLQHLRRYNTYTIYPVHIKISKKKQQIQSFVSKLNNSQVHIHI